MRSSQNNWSGILIIGISALMVLGALITALAQSNFRVDRNAPAQSTATYFQVMSNTPAGVDDNPAEATSTPGQDSADEQVSPSVTSSAETPQSKTATSASATLTETPASTPTDQFNEPQSQCGAPSNWIQYTVKSGDTLYSISVKYQTSVNDLKFANCLYSNTIITGSKLWVPNTPTITPTKTQSPTSTPKPESTNTPIPVASKTPTPTPTETETTPVCYALTLSTASGSGSAPTASPTNSTGCAAGSYLAGEAITLTASPASSWTVSGWSGTDNDASTSTTNTLTMPASAASASVTYTEICYTLSLSVASGNGSAPTASPTNSSGCAAGTYHAGETITLTASPTSGWTVGGWSGTDNDASTSTTNTLTMPASASSASVTYTGTCYALTLSADSGTAPTASPTNSSGCAAGSYYAGETITLTSYPSGGFTIWNGTDNDSSTSATNTLTMPAGPHTISVTYTSVAPPGP